MSGKTVDRDRDSRDKDRGRGYVACETVYVCEVRTCVSRSVLVEGKGAKRSGRDVSQRRLYYDFLE